MMNRRTCLCTLLCLMATAALHAQSFYTFSQSQQAYTPLTGANVLTTDFAQNNYALPLPAGYRLFNYLLPPQARVSELGYIEATGSTYAFSLLPYNIRLVPIGAHSAMLYKKEQSGADTIIKIEWRGMQVLNSPAGDSINMQVWVYQPSQAIEFRYGPSHMSAGYDQPFINLSLTSADFSNSFESHTLVGTAGTVSDDPDPNTTAKFSGQIPSGTVYRFAAMNTGIHPAGEAESFTLYPNPAVDGIVHLSIPAGSSEPFTLYDMQGAVRQQGIITGQGDIDLSTLPQAMYMLQIGGRVQRISRP
jgi:hypothetical protein